MAEGLHTLRQQCSRKSRPNPGDSRPPTAKVSDSPCPCCGSPSSRPDGRYSGRNGVSSCSRRATGPGGPMSVSRGPREWTERSTPSSGGARPGTRAFSSPWPCCTTPVDGYARRRIPLGDPRRVAVGGGHTYYLSQGESSGGTPSTSRCSSPVPVRVRQGQSHATFPE